MFTCFTCYVCILKPEYCILIKKVMMSLLISIRINKLLNCKLCLEEHCNSELSGCYNEAAIFHSVSECMLSPLFHLHILGCWHKSWCSAFLRRNRFCQG